MRISPPPHRLSLPSVVLALTSASCGHPTEERRTAPAAFSTFGPSDPRIQYSGRVDRRDRAVRRLAWPSTALTFRFLGTSARLHLRDLPYPDATPEADWLAISVDGGAPHAIALERGEHTYDVARDLPPGEHVLTVVKRTEAGVGTVEILGIELPSRARLLSPPPRPTRRIEVIGDSITAGFGSEGRDAACPFSAATENADAAYGAVAARALNAEVVAVAWSGKGVLRNADPLDTLPMPRLYERVLPAEERQWDFRTDPPDVLVVNLGANDFLAGSPDRQAFVGAYARFLDRLRALHPRAPIFVVLSPMIWDDATRNSRTEARDWLAALLAQRRAAGETGVEIVEQWAHPAEGFGCQLHPNVTAHARLGRELADVIRVRMRW